MKDIWYNIITEREAETPERIGESELHMKKYEARLSLETYNEKTGDWGERQVYQTESIKDGAEVCLIANELFEDPNQAIQDATADIFRDLVDEPDYSDVDTRWTLEIVEISDGGAEKILADCWEWESKLAKKFNDEEKEDD